MFKFLTDQYVTVQYLFRVFSRGILISLLTILATVSPYVLAHGDKPQQSNNPLFSGTDSAAAKVVIQFHLALKSGDAIAARALLAENVIIYEGGGVERSAAAYASHHLMADIKFLKGLSSTLLEHQVTVIGDLAYSISRSKVKGSYKDKAIDITSMETMLLNKIEGKWLISHIHWSN